MKIIIARTQENTYVCVQAKSPVILELGIFLMLAKVTISTD